jgi:hypothetical protein
MRLHPQRATALAFFALSSAYAAAALRLEDAMRSPVAVLGPRSFPLAIGAAGIVTSLVILLLEPAADGAPASTFAGDWRRTLALCALMVLYAAALPRLGFVLSTTAFLAASFRLLGERRAAALYGIPAAVAVGILLLLRGAFGAHLPEPLLDAISTQLR